MYNSNHLNKIDKIKLGSFYTPQKLVRIVYDYINPYLCANTVICDFAAGMGAFIEPIHSRIKSVAVDIDEVAIKTIEHEFPQTLCIHGSSLNDVQRTRFGLSVNDQIIAIGNPPYNDSTSLYKKGDKATNGVVDDDLKSRDIGISFLKMYDKLNADVVCILHPLSYLIKETNFLSLGGFRHNYRLTRAVIFSSAEFADTSSTEFPIMIGLYLRNNLGMEYATIRSFEFEVLGQSKSFRLLDYPTTDGFIHKYPVKKNDLFSLNIYFQTFRDINSLNRNATFTLLRTQSSITITVDTFYQYAYLFCHKQLFCSKFMFLFGNLSPLLTNRCLPDWLITDCIFYAFECSKALKEYSTMFIDEYQTILAYYNIDQNLVGRSDYTRLKKYFSELGDF